MPDTSLKNIWRSLNLASSICPYDIAYMIWWPYNMVSYNKFILKRRIHDFLHFEFDYIGWSDSDVLKIRSIWQIIGDVIGHFGLFRTFKHLLVHLLFPWGSSYFCIYIWNFDISISFSFEVRLEEHRKCFQIIKFKYRLIQCL